MGEIGSDKRIAQSMHFQFKSILQILQMLLNAKLRALLKHGQVLKHRSSIEVIFEMKDNKWYRFNPSTHVPKNSVKKLNFLFTRVVKTLVLYWVYNDYPMILYRPDVLK